MLRLARIWLALVVGSTAVAAAIAVVIAARGERAPRPQQEPVVVASASLTPRAPAFGDPIVARIGLVVDRKRVDPEDIQFLPRFAPFRQAGELDVERHDAGSVTRLTYTLPLECLSLECVPESVPALKETKSFRFPQTRFVFRVGGERRSVQAPPELFRPTGVPILGGPAGRWPELHIVTQLAAPELENAGGPLGPPLEALPVLDEPSYRLPPRLAQALLFLLASLLLSGAGVLVRPYLRRAPAPEPEPEPQHPELPPLERALVGLEWATRHAGPQEQRKALELLAEELEAHDEAELAEDARALAWSPDKPERASMERLGARVRELVEVEADAVPV
jgi:hypothetical protein